MTHFSPKPAMLPFWSRYAVAVIGFAAASLVQAQTPATSTVLAMSGSKNPDGVVRGPDGNLYGASATASTSAGGLIYRVATDGSSVATVYQLRLEDGVTPAGALLLGSDNLFYGTTQFSSGGVAAGGGTIFRVAPDGSGFTILHEFAG